VEDSDFKVGRNSDFQAHKTRAESVVKYQTPLKPVPRDSRRDRIDLYQL